MHVSGCLASCRAARFVEPEKPPIIRKAISRLQAQDNRASAKKNDKRVKRRGVRGFIEATLVRPKKVDCSVSIPNVMN
jgi:hypothetical protein